MPFREYQGVEEGRLWLSRGKRRGKDYDLSSISNLVPKTSAGHSSRNDITNQRSHHCRNGFGSCSGDAMSFGFDRQENLIMGGYQEAHGLERD